MKVTCPNDPTHKKFEVTAHVSQLWEVDEEGNFLDEIKGCEEVSHYPDSGDMFTCRECEAVAVAVRT